MIAPAILAAAAILLLLFPRLVLRSTAGDDLVPGDQAPLQHLVRFIAIVLAITAAILFFQFR